MLTLTNTFPLCTNLLAKLLIHFPGGFPTKERSTQICFDLVLTACPLQTPMWILRILIRRGNADYKITNHAGQVQPQGTSTAAGYQSTGVQRRVM